MFANAQDVANLLDSVASLAWPLVAVAALMIFKQEVSALLRRVTRGKAGPIEFEIDRQLDELQARTEEASKTLPPAQESRDNEATQERLLDRVLDEAVSSPKVALMSLSAALERKAREILASSHDPDVWKGRSLAQTLSRIELSPSVRAAFDEFRIVRNKIVHGERASDEDALRAIDLGVEIYNALDRIPREIHSVAVPRAEVFADSEGGRLFPDFYAVVISSAQTDGGDDERLEHAYPTRRDYEEGQVVTWEWDSAREYRECWYRDPRDGEIKYGWTRSFGFAGRPLADAI